MIREYNLDCVKFYLSHVLAKFPIVGRALCTKNQSHEYNLHCAKFTNQSHEYYLECAFFTNWSCVYYLDHLLYSALKSNVSNDKCVVDFHVFQKTLSACF